MKLIIGNFKMNLTVDEIDNYLQFFKNKDLSNVYFAPSYIYLTKFVENNLNTVSQDVSAFENGAYTGDISSSQLKSMGINYSIVGHSERRKYYNDDSFVNAKIKRLLDNNMVPILCIGETLDERKSCNTFQILEKELIDAFNDIEMEKLNNVIIAYEPVWAIGTGLIPTMNEIREVSLFIKDFIRSHYCFDAKVLYGGSVNNKCISDLETIDNIDGYLVGGCSIKTNDFIQLIDSIKKK